MKAKAPVILLTLLASFLIPMIGNVYGISGCTTACQVTVNSNVPSADGMIWVQIDNGTGSYCSSNPCTVALPESSPPTFNFANNTVHTIAVLNANTTFTGSSTGGHYVWKEWDNYYGTPSETKWTTNTMLVIGPILYNYTSTAGFTAVFDKQYKYTLSFTDINGNPLNPVPSSLSLQPQGSNANVTINSYSGQYLSASLYTVTGAHWEGVPIAPATTTETFDLTNGPATGTISLKAYPATIQIVDNNNNPVQGANVTITFANSTNTDFVSNAKGLVNLGDIPGGSFHATVHYQNQAYGPYTINVIGNPTNTITVNGGSTAATTTTAIVLLAIFGIAFFLILLAIKVRKPAAPPKIS